MGKYTSILESFPFESFAEYPENLRLDDKHAYLPKKIFDIKKYIPKVKNSADIVITILGFIEEEIGDDGMVYSLYYVYAEPVGIATKCTDETVYIMKAFGSPSHPYYGEKRMEIGDRFLRLETDREFIQTNDIIPATKLFYINESEYVFNSNVFFDYNTDVSQFYEKNGVYESEKNIYNSESDKKILEFINENRMETPFFKAKSNIIIFIEELRKDGVLWRTL